MSCIAIFRPQFPALVAPAEAPGPSSSGRLAGVTRRNGEFDGERSRDRAGIHDTRRVLFYFVRQVGHGSGGTSEIKALRVYVNSGYGMLGEMPRNVPLAFSADGK
jgi:hypothetical protein